MMHTIMQESVAGVQTPLAQWTYPRYRWEIGWEFLRQASSYAEMQSVISFFASMYGQQGVFQYLDPTDNLTGNQILGIAASSTSAFQLLRTRGSFVEPVFCCSTVTAITVGGSSVSTAAYTISNKGIIQFSTIAAGSTVMWAGTFNWFSRFDNDQYDFQQFTFSTDRQGPLWSVAKMSWVSVKFGA